MPLEAKNLREMSVEELNLRMAELQKEMFDNRLKATTKELTNPLVIRHARRDYARILTILNEKQRAAAK
jgi:large subunit ribosomal protein L29